ncbi:MAG: sulfatase [Candidatus Omnitrophica bacterium]|nr:sulfatase [Candidatus Omnitrophota bacterium]
MTVRRMFFAFIAGAAFFFCAATGVFAQTMDEVFAEFGFSLQGLGDFSLEKNTSRQLPASVTHTVLARKGDVVVKIEITAALEEGDARAYIKERNYVLESLFKRLPNPYPGMITNTIECPDAFKPEIIETVIRGIPVPVYILNSTPRFTYGACVDELIRYRGVSAFIYAADRKTLFRVELFYPKEHFDKERALAVLRSFSERERTPGELVDYRGCNLIIIGFDPLGANHLKLYGYERDTAPNLDAFARESVLFRNAVSPSSWTLPVFMSWFTSLYPSQHKVVNKYSFTGGKRQVYSNLQKLSPGTVTLAQVLKNDGYATAGFTGDAGVEGIFGYSQGFDVYYDKTAFGGFSLVFPKALQWLKKHRGEKVFLFIQAYDVHGRYKHEKNFRNKFADPSYKGKYRGTPAEYWQLRNESLENKPLALAEEDVQFWKDWYDGKIYEADKKLGAFLDELRGMGLYDNTIIVVSSASGNEFYEHRRFDHGYSLYDELIRVPLIIKIPGIEGKIIPEQVRTVDIMPTVLDLLGVGVGETTEKQMRGVSLVPFVHGESLKLDAFSETDYLLYSFKRSLRTSDGWKFIYSLESGERELYNLNIDPSETRNLADEEPQKALELEKELLRRRVSFPDGK